MRTGGIRATVVLSTLALALAACQTPPAEQHTGASPGGSIGKSMDEQDWTKAAHALETAPVGAPTMWRNPDTGSVYTVTPTRTYRTASGPCREYTTRAVIDGKEETVAGTACRQPDGTWKAA